MRYSAVLALAGVALAGGCNDSTQPQDNQATTIAQVDGNGQQALAESKLPAPLRVLVTDAGGQPVAGARVTASS